MTNQKSKEYKSSEFSDLTREINSDQIDDIAQNIITITNNNSKVLDNIKSIRNFSKTHDITDCAILDSTVFKKPKPL